MRYFEDDREPDVDPDDLIDWDECCPRDHRCNRATIRELVEMLNEGTVDYDVLIHSVNQLAENYGINGVKYEYAVRAN